MTTQTFQVQVDYTTLTMLGAVENGGDVTFAPRFATGKWSTDGQRIANAKAEKKAITSLGGAQTFTLAHPNGWLIGFQWLVTVVIDGETILGPTPIRIPEPGEIKWLPDLLNFEISVPGVPVVFQTVVLPASIQDGDVPVKDGVTFRGVPVADLEGGGGGGAVDSVNGQTGVVVLSTADVSDFTTAVDTRIQGIVGAAPAALNTLAELAEALGDDADFAASVTTALAGKVPMTDPRLSDARPPTAHNHSFSQVPGLNTALTGKAGTTTGTTVDSGPVRPAFGIANRIFVEVIL